MHKQPRWKLTGALVFLMVSFLLSMSVIRAQEETPEATETPEPTLEVTPEATDEDLPVTIVIVGPVQTININIITIYNITIQLDPDDPILQTLQIGQEVQVQGNVTGDSSTTIIIVVVNITYVTVVDNGGSGGGSGGGDCGHGPPPWAPAHGWRRHCENSQGENEGGD